VTAQVLQRSHRRYDSYPALSAVALGVTALCVLPIAALLLVALKPELALWQHLAANVLPYAARDTALLVAGVAVLTSVIGTVMAALVALTNFPGRKWVASAAILPLAFPVYLFAFIYVELFDASGPVQQFIRSAGWTFRLPEIRSTGGAILIFSLVLYPYVFLSMLLAFNAQSRSFRDAARVLGCSELAAFFKVQIPAARPALFGGVMLALMETVADFGASEYLGVRTFAFTIYSTWTTRSSLAAAAQISLVLILIVALFIFLESRSRKALSHHMRTTRSNASPRIALSRPYAILALVFCWLVLIASFVVPLGFVVFAFIDRLARGIELRAVLQPLYTTLLLASISATIVLVCAAIIAIRQRQPHGPAVSLMSAPALLGYAMPGVVLALGLLFAGTYFDNTLDHLVRSVFGFGTGLLITGTPAILIIAYLCRFAAVGHGPVHARLQQIPVNLEYVSRTLGRSRMATIKEVLLPLLKPTIAAAWLLLAVDIVKELQMTLLLRPIGIETLATSLYGHASRGQFEDGVPEAFAILCFGIIAVAALQRLIRKGAVKRF
jgi:iron(III) transport system permease protein